MSREPIVHREVALLQVSEPAVIDEIEAVLPLEPYVLGRLSPTELIIDPARIGELASHLDEKGLTPLVRRVRREVRVEDWSGREDTRPVVRRRR